MSAIVLAAPQRGVGEDARAPTPCYPQDSFLKHQLISNDRRVPKTLNDVMSLHDVRKTLARYASAADDEDGRWRLFEFAGREMTAAEIKQELGMSPEASDDDAVHAMHELQLYSELMPALMDAKGAVRAGNPQLYAHIEESMRALQAHMPSREAAFMSRGIFGPDVNATRARAMYRVDVAHALSSASLMLVHKPEKVLEGVKRERATALGRMEQVLETLRASVPAGLLHSRSLGLRTESGKQGQVAGNARVMLHGMDKTVSFAYRNASGRFGGDRTRAVSFKQPRGVDVTPAVLALCDSGTPRSGKRRSGVTFGVDSEPSAIEPSEIEPTRTLSPRRSLHQSRTRRARLRSAMSIASFASTARRSTLRSHPDLSPAQLQEIRRKQEAAVQRYRARLLAALQRPVIDLGVDLEHADDLTHAELDLLLRGKQDFARAALVAAREQADAAEAERCAASADPDEEEARFEGADVQSTLKRWTRNRKQDESRAHALLRAIDGQMQESAKRLEALKLPPKKQKIRSWDRPKEDAPGWDGLEISTSRSMLQASFDQTDCTFDPAGRTTQHGLLYGATLHRPEQLPPLAFSETAGPSLSDIRAKGHLSSASSAQPEAARAQQHHASPTRTPRDGPQAATMSYVPEVLRDASGRQDDERCSVAVASTASVVPRGVSLAPPSIMEVKQRSVMAAEVDRNAKLRSDIKKRMKEMFGVLDDSWESEMGAFTVPQLPAPPPEASRTFAALVQWRMERVWSLLRLPAAGKVDMLLAYARWGAAGSVDTTLALWERAAAAVMAREAALRDLLLVQQEALKEDPNVRRLAQAVPRSIALLKVTRHTDSAARALREGTGAELTYEGAPYPGPGALRKGHLADFCEEVQKRATDVEARSAEEIVN